MIKQNNKEKEKKQLENGKKSSPNTKGTGSTVATKGLNPLLVLHGLGLIHKRKGQCIGYKGDMVLLMMQLM